MTHALPSHTAEGLPLIRQSLLRQFTEDCPLATSWDHYSFREYDPLPAGLGTIMHRVGAEILRTLNKTKNTQIPTEEAIVIFREVYAQMGEASEDVVILDSAALDAGRILTLMLASYQWPAQRILRSHRGLAIEQRLDMNVDLPQGETVVLTGQPDALFADPPHGAAILDLKFGRTKPPAPRDDNWQRENGKPYLSHGGLMQLKIYGPLVLHAYPAVQHVRLKQRHVRLGEDRDATMSRDDLEHALPELSMQLGLLHRALKEGPESAIWKPRPGSWCSHCPRVEACPIPAAERGEGKIETAEQAVAVGERWVTGGVLKDEDRDALKAWWESNGPIPLGDGEIGWHDRPSGKGRSFGFAVIPEPVAV